MAKRSRKKQAKSVPAVELSTARQPGDSAIAFVWILVRALIITTVGTWIFLPALHGEWIWDDTVYILNNPLTADPARLWKIWFVPGSWIEYYPVEQMVQWAQWELFHTATLGYHLTNLVLHLVSALLVWRLLSKFGLRLAWLGGLLFAIHPANVESVAWISELKNTLSLPPFLLAACAYIDYDNRGRRADYLIAIGLFFLAMLCKISMALFPLIILLYAWWKRGRIGWGDVKASAPFFAISLVLGVTTILAGIWFRPTHHMGVDHVEAGGILSRLDLLGLLPAWYLYQVICPVTHSFFYPKWTIDPPAAWQFLTWPIFAGLFYFLWTRRQGWGRHALLGLGFFFINLAPFLGLTIPSYMGFTWAMDHFLYLPIIGLIGLAVAGVESLDQRVPKVIRSWCLVTGVAIMAGLAWSSHLYASTFATATALWSNTIVYAPKSETAHNNLGISLMHEERFQEAIDQYELAASLAPLDGEIHNNLGQTLAQLGRFSEAMTEFDTALRLNPQNASASANRGHLWQIMGDPDKAIAELTRAIQLNPDLPQSYLNRSASRQIKGDWQGELADLQSYCRVAPQTPNTDYAHLRIWLTLAQHGQKAAADNELTSALEKNWNSPRGEWPAQIARFLLGQINEEALLFAASATIPEQDKYQHCEAWYYAGMKRLLAGDRGGAGEAFRKCLATDEKQTTAYSLAQAQLNLLKAH